MFKNRSLFTRSVRIFKNVRFQSASVQNENLPHLPVMVNEVLEYLQPNKGQLLLDMTFGAGGHSEKLLQSCSDIKLLALDRDPVAYDYAHKLKNKYPSQVIPLLGRFSELPALLKQNNIYQNSIDGILFDFGCSSMQFDVAERGFSLSKNGPLDMRMDGSRFPNNPTASDVLTKATEDDIFKILKVYGEEKQARKIAQAIVEARYLFKRLNTTEELADLVESVCSGEVRLDKLQRKSHQATKTFQALRIFVNNELNEINYGLILAQKYLKIGGRLVAITFHSLEDTIVKRHMVGNMIENTANPLPLKYSSHTLSIERDIIEEVLESNWKMLHKHVLVPKFEEVENNPRCRSAKFRAAVRVK